ncbi:MAG: 2-hydroxychromene-2-carboxylate isomerase [Burkholderiaceae bacterium]|nr:2-hydroxychromene-2-carboxylate isomerase [Burkholderiaceae bacterium]
MSLQADFYFDYGSPTSYLAWVQLPGIVERTGVTIHYKPILLGGVLKAAGNASPMDVPAKRNWMARDMASFARRYGVPFRLNPLFPINTLPLMRGAIHAQREGFLVPYSDAMFRAMWVDARDMSNPAVIAEVLAGAGIDAARLMAGAQEPGIKEALKAETEAAVQRGLFGAPVLFVGDEMFFGQDRLPYAEEQLRSLGRSAP